ncbi:unnamed protein product [Staurois parvus]|uniref:KIND domain-containing protein n=1 Tax=Staurois parvus TaxID=386267 RepID=A0ABN9GY61_9NEOB|nr:unnamed protein product [Staurois parvus]
MGSVFLSVMYFVFSLPGTPDGAPNSSLTETQMVQCLGFVIYRALDWGLDESEERELSPQLEQLIDLMAASDSEGSMADEGYEGTEDEDEEGPPRVVRSFSAVMRFCASHLPEPKEAPIHYQAVLQGSVRRKRWSFSFKPSFIKYGRPKRC